MVEITGVLPHSRAARAGIAVPDTTSVMAAAKNAIGAADPNAYANALSQLKREFSIYVNAVHEAYPDLKANENFADLQAQLEGTENRISVERKNFNDAVKDYNTGLRRFPTNIVANMFGFEKKAYFEAAAGSEVAPKVEF